jgi:nucleoporin NUP42
MFKGKPVSYEVIGSRHPKVEPVVRNFNGTITKICFPDGALKYTSETEAASRAEYDDPVVQRQWAAFVQTGKFEGGLMPEVPPKREYCMWDF